ncbi:TIGR00255 family protein [Tranquillimonas alkanivorans]|uniref:TIGR00255 family protein n=2 Tax=Tranquillimonas alkanivorans TaxID=441119 RepID=A0A1I5P2Y5_9RHOB|nr:TIGR00255 family protein [Tranquillimonas alkanivorans]
MPKSMTGFATLSGEHGPWSWTWDIRGVNGRGLDLRVRVPDWIEGLEPAVRAAVPQAVKRGSVTVSLRLTRAEDEAAAGIDPAGLTRVLEQLRQVEATAAGQGLALRPTSAAEIVAMRGVQSAGRDESETQALSAALVAQLPGLLGALDEMRAREGAALVRNLSAQVDDIARLTGEARALIDARRDQMAEALRRNLARVMENADGADPDRVAQELALIAVKADVTEELDRLDAHVTAARALVAAEGPVGRKLDFLCQEFNREANTLCSKAQNAELTGLGLDLKTAIDQMREQIQNVE